MNEQQLNEEGLIKRLSKAFFNLLDTEEKIALLEDEVEVFKSLYRKAEAKNREIGIDDVINKVFAGLVEQGHEYPYMHDLVMNENGASVIFGDYGNLFRADFTIVGSDEILLDRIQQVKIVYEDIDRKMRVYRSADNKLKFLAIAASTVMNRVGEIDSRDLFDDFEERFNDDVYLTFHHYDREFEFGSVEGVFRLNNLLIAYGVIDETTTLGKYAERAFSEGDWGLSVGFQPLAYPELVDVGGVEIPTYREGVLVEISVLKESDAASYMTTIGSVDREFKTMGLDAKQAKKKLLEFTGIDGEEEVEALLNEANLRERAIVDSDMITRDAEEAELEEEVNEVEDTVEEDVEEVEETEETEEEAVEENEKETEAIEFDIDEVVIQKITEVATERVASIIEEKFSKFDELFDSLATRMRSIEENIDTIQRSVHNNTERLGSVERSEEKKVQEAVEDLPTATKRKIDVNYRPLAEVKERSVTEMTLQEIAHATLDSQ